jgi:poly-beta-1,6-N-acetyl-D-glucosamine synthase
MSVWISIIAALLYFLCIGLAIWGWYRILHQKPKEALPFQHFISILVPFRNEEKNLPLLLESLQNEDPELLEHCEIILINDGSDDKSEESIKPYCNKFENFQCITSKGQGKKDALLLGIQHAKNEWIVTLDADVVVQKNWLYELLTAIHTNKAQFLVLPVQYERGGTYLQRFQALENSALVCMSAGALQIGLPFTANGAHLAYTKTLFHTIGGFSPEKNIPSGDDEFLMLRAFSFNPSLCKAVFSRSLIVYTQAPEKIPEFINQRTRWASKAFAKSPKSIYAKALGLWTLVFILSFVAALLGYGYTVFVVLWLSKILADSFLFLGFYRFFSYPWYYIAMLPFVGIFQVLYFVPVLLLSIFGRYKWKGRNYGTR